MFSLSTTVLPRSESAVLLSAKCGNDGKLGSWCCNGKVFSKKIMCEQFVRSFGRISDNCCAVRAVAHSDFSDVGTSEKLAAYRFMIEGGGQLKAVVLKKPNEKYGLQVEVESLFQELVMIWGLFRADSKSFLSLNAGSIGSVEAPFVRDSAGRLAAELVFQENLAPFYVSFLLKSQLGAVPSCIRSHRKTNFIVPVGFGSGSPAPLGPSFLDDGSVNLAFFAGNVDRVVLCLYTDEKGDKPAIEIDLDPYVNRTGEVWHALIQDSMQFVRYGYYCRRVSDGQDHCFVVDPYSMFIEEIAKGFLGRLYKEPPFDWSGEIRPNLPMEKMVIYRFNVARFTEDGSSNLPANISGSFSSISEKLHHFVDLGVNAILLEPVFPFDEQKGAYFPLHFFSACNLYSPSKDPKTVAKSMKEMVKKLHSNGIEVLLEVAFTHTGDGENEKTRNALSCNNPVIVEMILKSLRYWVTEFHIDGFCFVNASGLLKGLDGENLPRPPLIEAVSFDPVLSKVKLIADFWDPDNMEIKDTLFPHWKRWGEMNSRFCRDVRSFLKGDCPLSNFATRLCGSGDLFLSGRGPAFSLNYVTRNAGLTLVDLVSFSSSDSISESSELSWNCGEEGPSSNSIVLETRLKQIRNFLLILFVSLGVPVLNMGDEYGDSMAGSLLYSDRQPLNWNALKSSFGVQITQFFSFLSSLRARRSDMLQRNRFMDEKRIEWRGSQQSPPNWDEPSSKFLAVILKPTQGSHQNHGGGELFMAFNSGHQTENVVVPEPASGETWVRLVDTALPFPGFFEPDGVPLGPGEITYEMKLHSCVVFEARKLR